MRHAAYYEAAIPEPRTILGLNLRPLSLGHVELLHRIKSPFLTEGARITYADVATAVLICSLPYEEAVDALDDPNLETLMGQWANKLLYPTLREKLTRIPRVIDLKEKAQAFHQYLEDHSKAVNAFLPDGGTGDPIDLPLHQIVKVGLMAYLNHTYSEAVNKPWGLALSDYFTWMAIEGRANIIEAAEYEDLQKQANDFHAKYLKRWQSSPSSQN